MFSSFCQILPPPNLSLCIQSFFVGLVHRCHSLKKSGLHFEVPIGKSSLLCGLFFGFSIFILACVFQNFLGVPLHRWHQQKNIASTEMGLRVQISQSQFVYPKIFRATGAQMPRFQKDRACILGCDLFETVASVHQCHECFLKTQTGEMGKLAQCTEISVNLQKTKSMKSNTFPHYWLAKVFNCASFGVAASSFPACVLKTFWAFCCSDGTNRQSSLRLWKNMKGDKHIQILHYQLPPMIKQSEKQEKRHLCTYLSWP